MISYVLSCAKPEEGGGIYKYISLDGKLILEKYLSCDRPMYALKSGNRIHILLREVSEKNSGYFSVDENLGDQSCILDTKGIVACHLAVECNDNYIVNYLSGNVVKNCRDVINHSGKGINSLRQEASHTHCVIFSPDKKYVFVTDLGLDTIFVYDRNLIELGKIKVPDGYGIRHIVFSTDEKYIYGINELMPSISIFRYNKGKSEYIRTEKIPCENIKANGAAIRVSIDGKYLYCSVREENALYVYEINAGKLVFKQKTSCGGDSPRDIFIKDKFLLCANEKSDNLSVFTLNNGQIERQIENIIIKNPLCVL